MICLRDCNSATVTGPERRVVTRSTCLPKCGRSRWLGGGETRLDASGQHVGPFRAAVARKSKIEATFAQLSAEHQGIIALAFEPRRYIGDGGAVEIELRQRMTFGGRDEGSVSVCLLQPETLRV